MSLENPVRTSSISIHNHSRDACQDFLAHHHLQVESASQVFAITEQFMEIMMFPFESYNSSHLQFVTDWFKKLRLLNDFATHDDHLPFIFVRDILIHAVSSCEFLSKVVKEAKPSVRSVFRSLSLLTVVITLPIKAKHAGPI